MKDRPIKREDSVLVFIDIQEKLLPVMSERDSVRDNAIKLARFADIIGLPVLVTEQIRLGPTIPELSAEIKNFQPVEKSDFDALQVENFQGKLKDLGRTTLILTGIEAHICVAQTALTALENYTVHVVRDAVSSRSKHNRKIAERRLTHAGAVITSTEMVMYELLGKAGTDEFRAVLKLVK